LLLTPLDRTGLVDYGSGQHSNVPPILGIENGDVDEACVVVGLCNCSRFGDVPLRGEMILDCSGASPCEFDCDTTMITVEGVWYIGLVYPLELECYD